jgi:hypothetical protein
MAKKILIIDDDPAFREMVGIALREKIPDLQIDEARDGHIGERNQNTTLYCLITNCRSEWTASGSWRKRRKPGSIHL